MALCHMTDHLSTQYHRSNGRTRRAKLEVSREGWFIIYLCHLNNPLYAFYSSKIHLLWHFTTLLKISWKKRNHHRRFSVCISQCGPSASQIPSLASQSLFPVRIEFFFLASYLLAICRGSCLVWAQHLSMTVVCFCFSVEVVIFTIFMAGEAATAFRESYTIFHL